MGLTMRCLTTQRDVWKVHLGDGYAAAPANGGDATLLGFLSHNTGRHGRKVWTEPRPTSLGLFPAWMLSLDNSVLALDNVAGLPR